MRGALPIHSGIEEFLTCPWGPIQTLRYFLNFVSLYFKFNACSELKIHPQLVCCLPPTRCTSFLGSTFLPSYPFPSPPNQERARRWWDQCCLRGDSFNPKLYVDCFGRRKQARHRPALIQCLNKWICGKHFQANTLLEKLKKPLRICESSLEDFRQSCTLTK